MDKMIDCLIWCDRKIDGGAKWMVRAVKGLREIIVGVLEWIEKNMS